MFVTTVYFCRRYNKKLMDNVRYLNVKQFESLSRSTSGRTSPVSNWSFASDERSDTASTMSYESKNLTSFLGYYGIHLLLMQNVPKN